MKNRTGVSLLELNGEILTKTTALFVMDVATDENVVHGVFRQRFCC